LAREHALTRSVRDSAALLDAASGPELGDPYWAPPPARPFLSEIGAPPGKLRIAFTPAPGHRDCSAAVADAAALCAQLGHELTEVAPPASLARAHRLFRVLQEVECAWQLDDWAERTGRPVAVDRLEAATAAFYEAGRRHGAAAYLRAWRELQALSREVARLFVDHDVWLTATTTQPPAMLNLSRGHKDDSDSPGSLRFAPFLMLPSVTGQPSASVPLFWTDDGLPIGTHFVARFGDEATLFRLASQLEAARPWAAKV
jgi:amidase